MSHRVETSTDLAEAGGLSSYAVLIGNSILERFNIKLTHTALREKLKSQQGIYAQLLRVPLLNVFNGIVYQQGYDYQVYLQQLLIDYRLSEEYAKEPDTPGAGVRRDLDEEYDIALALVKAFDEGFMKHNQLISHSQAWLIQTIKPLVTAPANPDKTLSQLLTDAAFMEQLQAYVQQGESLGQVFRDYRGRFYDAILRTRERLNALPDYRLNPEQTAQALENIVFDSLSPEVSSSAPRGG